MAADFLEERFGDEGLTAAAGGACLATGRQHMASVAAGGGEARRVGARAGVQAVAPLRGCACYAEQRRSRSNARDARARPR